MTWSFFGDRVLRERTRRSDKKEIESKEDTKVWEWEGLRKLCLIPRKLIKKYGILYVVSKGDMGQSQQLSYSGTKSTRS